MSLGCAFATDWMGLDEGAFISSRGIRWGSDFLLESLPACLNLRMKSAQPVRSRPPVCGRRENAPDVVNPGSGKRKYIYPFLVVAVTYCHAFTGLVWFRGLGTGLDSGLGVGRGGPGRP